MSVEHKEDTDLEQVFKSLAQCELEMDEVEKRAEIQRIKLTKPIFSQRSALVSQIPKFWYIVLAEHEDFQEYIQTDDMKYLEFIKNIYVDYLASDNDDLSRFSIIFEIECSSGEIETQTVTKLFEKFNDGETGEEKLKSVKTSIEWPGEFKKINPELIKQKQKTAKLSSEDKKNYRIGMKSFFAFFDWTGERPGKEYRHGEDLALLISEDIFPHATKYYTEAAPGLGGDDNDEDAGTSSEELDLGDDDEDDDDEPPAKKPKK